MRCECLDAESSLVILSGYGRRFIIIDPLQALLSVD
jgi:hypothetical protein